MIKVSCEVEVWEYNGVEMRGLHRPILTVTHDGLGDSNFVVLKFGNETIKVGAKDLHTAVNNATNLSKF